MLNSAQSVSRFSGATGITESEAVLVFSTPQFAAELESRVSVKLIKDFKSISTLEEDIKKANFKKDDIIGPFGKPLKFENRKI